MAAFFYGNNAEREFVIGTSRTVKYILITLKCK